MRINFNIAVFVFLFTCLSLHSFSQNKPEVEVNITDQGKFSKLISLSFQAFSMHPSVIEGVTYYGISLAGLQQLCHEGSPVFPVYHRLVEVPEGYDLQISAIDYHTQTYEGIRPLPYQPAPDRNSRISKENNKFNFNPEIYQGETIYPSVVAEVTDYHYVAGMRVADLIIYPFRFNPQENSLLVHKNIEIKISYVKQKSMKINESYYSERIQKIAGEMVIRFNGSERQYSEPKSPSLLIIVHDEFYENILPFAEWKNRKGIDTRVVKVSEINKRSQSENLRENITGFIKDEKGKAAYDYLLLVGDIDYIPPFYGVHDALNDHNYSTLNDGDFLPDIMVGRFSVNSPEECDIYVTKIINYEKNVYQADSYNWMKKATVAASSEKLDDRHGIHIISLFNSLGFTKVDDLRHSQQRFTNYHIINALNEGRSWMFYIGHGDEVSWLTTGTCTNYTISNNLTYSGTLPMIISVACLNNDLDYKYGNSFGEKWMNAGVDKGAIGFIGATELTPFYYSDTLGKHALIGYLNDNVQTIGEALVYGKLKLYESFTNNSPSGQTLETMQHFLLLGDPTLMPYTDKPAEITASLPAQLKCGTSQLTLMVKSGNNPVKNALVSVTSSDFSIKQSAYTDEAGNVSFQLEVQDTGLLYVVITGKNLKYFEKTIQVTNQLSDFQVFDNQFINVYPNPVTDFIYLSSTAGLKIKKAELMDLNGKVVISKEPISVSQMTIPANALPSGIYVMQITLEDGQILQKKLAVYQP